MDLNTVICFALCGFTLGRPQLGYDDAGIQEAISNLQLLIPLLVENSLVEEREAESGQYGAQSYPSHSRYLAASSLAYPVMKARQKNTQKNYSLDGPFSDIPADAFKLEHRKEFEQGESGRITKKDLSRDVYERAPSPTANTKNKRQNVDVPKNLIKTCLNYFQGKAQPQPNSMELLLNICNELLGEDGVEDFAVSDETRHDDHQQKYNFKAKDDENEQHHHHHHLHADGTLECECCPLEHNPGKGLARNDDIENDRHDDRADDRNDDRDDDRDDDRKDDREDDKSETLLDDIFRLFRPLGHRRGWSVVKTKNPDKRLKQYVDVDSKKNPFII